jgi:hypothetical protein
MHHLCQGLFYSCQLKFRIVHHIFAHTHSGAEI